MAKILLTIQADNKATESVKALNAEVRVLSQTLSSIKVNKNLTAQINALTKHYTALAKAQAKIIANNNKQAISDEKVKQQQAKTAQQVANAAAAQARLEKAQRKTSATTEQLQRKFANLLSTIKSIKNAYPEGTFEKLEQSVRANLQAAKDGSKSVEELGNAYSTLSKDVAVAKAETDKVTTAVVKSGDSIASLAKKFLLWQVTATLVMQPIRLLQNALTSINETLVKTEDAVIALQRVLPTGSATNDEISSRLYKVAQDYGQTFENVSQIATNFARTGMSWSDTIKATEAAVLALNVAELNAEEATTGLIAILSQFNLEASDLEDVIDKLNKTADNFPVTTEKILAALQRTGSAASNANLSLNQTIALITALSKATGRSGENIGTALNSLIQYSSKASALDTFAALSDESAEVVANFRKGMLKENGESYTILDVWRQVSKEIQNIKTEQADLLDSYFDSEDGEALKEALDGELQDIYTELGGVYDTANTFRKNYFIALLGNMDTVEQALGTLDNAAGYSQSENEEYLKTYTGKLNKLQSKWQEVANDEQGLLGIKKDLLDMGIQLLDIIQGVGGLKTAFVALGVVVGSLLMAFKGEAILATLTKMGTVIKALTIDAIPNFIATLQAWRGQTTLLNGQVVQLTGSTATFGQVVKTALPLVTILIIAISALDSAIRQDAEERAEAERQAREDQDAAIAKANERIETQKKEVQSMEEVAASVEELRNVLSSSIATETEKRAAQEKLLQIQNTLIESNNAYADSLDLQNGALKEQLGLIEQLTTEQLKQKAQEWLDSTESERAIANSRLTSESTTSTDSLLSGHSIDRYKFRDIINQAIQGAGIEDVTNIIEDNFTSGFWGSYFHGVKEGWQENGIFGAFGGLGNGFDDLFSEEGWVGQANAGFSFSGTTEEKLAAVKTLREYIAKHYDELGLTDAQNVTITTELDKQYELLNDDAYKQAQRTREIEQATYDWFNGTITEAEYLEKVYGISKAIADETEDWHNNIAKATDKYDDLIDKLEALRDANKEGLELEEKKRAIIDAQNNLEEKKNDLLEKQNELQERQNDLIEARQALENAQNEATVRRFNETTRQWEWQVDEKKIAEAEEKVQKAEDDVEKAQEDILKAQEDILKAQEDIQKAIRDLEKQAYDTIIDQLKNNTATNDGLNELLDGLKGYLDDSFMQGIKDAILKSVNVNLDKPIVEPQPKEDKNPTDEPPTKKKWSSYEDAAAAGFSQIRTTQEFMRGNNPDRNKYGDYQTYLDAMYDKYVGENSYDNGGAAIGKGLMRKETDETETVINPDLTEKILSPVSNAHFDRWVHDMGLLFETSRQYAQSSPIVERVGGNTDNRVNNSGQVIIKDVNVGAERRDDLLDILRLAPLTSDN